MNVKWTLNRTRRMYSHTDVGTRGGVVGDGSREREREHRTKAHVLALDPRDLSKLQTVVNLISRISKDKADGRACYKPTESSHNRVNMNVRYEDRDRDDWTKTHHSHTTT